MTRKFIYYFKNFSRPIVITDQENTPLEQLKNDISNIMSGKEISVFETNDDVLIARPFDIAAVHIAKNSLDHSNEFDNLEDHKEDIGEINLQAIVPEIDLGDVESKEIITEDIESMDEEIQKVIEDESDVQEEEDVITDDSN